MSVILFKFLRPAIPYLIVMAAIVAGIFYVTNLRRDLAAATAKEIALADQNQADVAAIAAYKAQQSKWTEALATLDAKTLSASGSVNHIVTAIGASPASDDGPVAPVLTRALDGLRALQGSAP